MRDPVYNREAINETIGRRCWDDFGSLMSKSIVNDDWLQSNLFQSVHTILRKVSVSKTKIYIVLEYVNEGELFDKIALKGRLLEHEGRKLFQLLIDALENILVDVKGNAKVSDFDLSTLPQHLGNDGLLHTICGSPNYIALEVLLNRGLMVQDQRHMVLWINIARIKEHVWFKQDCTLVAPIYDAEDIDPRFESQEEGDLEKPNFNKENEWLGLPKGWQWKRGI
ncbi:hypothetical protein ZIOFF_029807 [Zingiber officinale]|uniref:Protein kinase domain-containing protein n=1 Tax=Zingiber officinale TaxID=94328 RepID=A0A8J5GQ41_ZINOF|nr:hypothetical protein ZIOFF_029807 [Zingiber officinale]